jgi:polyisoprenoid-binding protein YceI
MTYNIDTTHTTIQFCVRHLMIANIRGVFTKFTGTSSFDPANAGASSLSISIETGSVSTPDGNRNEHLKGADFFDAATYPEIKFVSKSVAAAGPGAYKVTGDLSMHGVTQETVLNVSGMSDETKDPWGNMRRGCAATTRLSRKAFGLTWNAAIESGGVLISDEVDITLDVELVRQP